MISTARREVSHTMKIELDPSALRARMKIWREAVDLQMPMDEASMRHFVAQRTDLLKGFGETAASWLFILRSCRGEGPDDAALRELRNEVDHFQALAVSSLEGIQMAPAQPVQTSVAWRTAFCEEWCRLAEGKPDAKQVLEWATELYPTHWRRDPVSVAREEWGC